MQIFQNEFLKYTFEQTYFLLQESFITFFSFYVFWLFGATSRTPNVSSYDLNCVVVLDKYSVKLFR